MISLTSIISVLSNTLASSTPLALAGVGGLFGEKSGISNIGLEGTMIFSAFAAALGSYLTGSAWMGLLCAAATGMLVSLLHAFCCITLKANHSIIGLGINILASNLTVFASNAIFGFKGYTAAVEKLPYINVPVLKDIPVVGSLFSNISALTIIAVFVTIIAAYLMNRTPYGMHVTAAGANPHAAYVAGVKVERTQYSAVMLGGLTCGLAGAYMSISYLNMFVRDMISGRGFIAIAAILFGRYSPWGVYCAALFFGLANAVQMALQGTINIDNEVIQCIPYLLTIIAVAFNEWREIKKR